mgnify:CR=1 FL=1
MSTRHIRPSFKMTPRLLNNHSCGRNSPIRSCLFQYYFTCKYGHATLPSLHQAFDATLEIDTQVMILESQSMYKYSSSQVIDPPTF